MEALGLLGITAFAFTSLVVGVRLVWLARRTRQYPELAAGASFFLAGFVSLGLNLWAQHGNLEPELRLRVGLASLAIGDVGYALLASFVWRVFRRDSVAGALGFAAAAAGLAAGFAVTLATAEPSEARTVGSGFWTTLVTQIALYGWATAESLHYWWLLRRRARIGLAEPLVANRFLLWGIGTAAVVGIWLHMGWTLMHQATADLSGADYLVISFFGFTCAAACWIAFLPPRFYVRRFAMAPAPSPTGMDAARA